MWTARPWLLLSLLYVVACGDDQGPAVPFKLGVPEGVDDNAAPTEPEAPAVASPPPTERVGASFEPGTRSVTLGQQSLTATDASFIAALEVDLNADANNDALALTLDAHDVLALQSALAGTSQLAPVKPLLTLQKGCHVDSVRSRIASISASYVVATALLACAASEHGVAQPDVVTELHWIIGVGAIPRVMERIRLLPDPQAKLATTIAMTIQARDIDNDQNDDVIATLKITSLDGIPSEAPLRWLNRVGGLDLDRGEPEASLAAKLSAAKKLQAPDERTRALLEITRAHDLVCSESGHARVVIGDRVGIACGRSKAAGNAWALLTKTYAANHAQGGDQALLNALDAFDRLAQPTLAVDVAERTAAEQALKNISAAARWNWVPGPNVMTGRAPLVRLPVLGFVDATTLLIRGATTQHYDIVSGSVTEVGNTPNDLLVRDPSGAFAVVDVERHCDGYRLKVVRAEQVANGVVIGPSMSEPLIEALTAPATARCDQPNPTYRGANDGRWNVLGWAPGSIVVALGRSVRALRLDAMAHAAGAASEATFPLPAPVAAAAIAPDGSAYATLTNIGIFVASAHAGASLVEPLGPVSSADLAVAPEAARLAYVFGDRVFIGSPAPRAP